MAYSFQNKASNVGVTVGELNEVVNNTPPYRVYTALLTQSGTDAPVATVLENTLGGDIIWSRTGAGIYKGTLLNTFTNNKTFCFISSQQYISYILRNTLDEIGVATTDLSDTYVDDLLIQTPIEIRVYN